MSKVHLISVFRANFLDKALENQYIYFISSLGNKIYLIFL